MVGGRSELVLLSAFRRVEKSIIIIIAFDNVRRLSLQGGEKGKAGRVSGGNVGWIGLVMLLGGLHCSVGLCVEMQCPSDTTRPAGLMMAASQCNVWICREDGVEVGDSGWTMQRWLQDGYRMVAGWLQDGMGLVVGLMDVDKNTIFCAPFMVAQDMVFWQREKNYRSPDCLLEILT